MKPAQTRLRAAHQAPGASKRTPRRLDFGRRPRRPAAWLLGCVLPASLFGVRAFGQTTDTAAPSAPAPTSEAPKKTEATAPPIDLQTLMTLKVKTASKFEQPISQAPSSITVVTEQEIKRFGYRTLADLLRGVRDLHVSYDRVYSFLGVRGFNPGDFNSRILLLVNGHRINQNLSDAAPIGTDFLLDVDLIKRVEIIRGPGSVLYGSNALLAVINVITREGADLSNLGVEAAAAYGSFDSWQGRVTVGRSFKNGLDFLASGTVYDSTGEGALYSPQFDTPANNQGVFLNGDTDRAYKAFGSVSYHDLTLEAGFVSREKRNPTAQYGTAFNDHRHQLTDRRAYVDVRFERQLAADLDLSARAYYDRYEFEGEFPFTAGLATFERDERLGQWYGLEAQVNKRLWEHHQIAFGGEFRNDFSQERTYSQLEPTFETLAHTERTRLSYSAFVNSEFQLLPHRPPNQLTFNAGLRYDGYDQFDQAFNPRVALIYHPWNRSTFKGIYGTAFRAPNFYELFDPFHQDIDPERISTYEGIYEQGLGRHFRTALVGFYNHIQDAIGFDFRRGASRYRNFRGAETMGFSTEIEAIGTRGWTAGFRGHLGYTYQLTGDLETNTRLTDSPEHLVKFNLSVPFWADRLVASTEAQYTSARASVAPGPGGTLVPGGEAGAFLTWNFSLLAQKLVKGLELSASVYNLLDEKNGDPATLFHAQDLIPQIGRTFWLKVRYQF